MAAINLNKVKNPSMKPIIDSFLKKGVVTVQGVVIEI